MKLRTLVKGHKYNVVAIAHVANDITIYQINELEYISSDDAIEFVTDYFIPSQGENKYRGKCTNKQKKVN